MKKLIAMAAAFLVCLAFGSGTALAKDMPKDPIRVDSGEGKKPGVTFDHQLHKEKNPDLDCSACHHVEGKDQYKKCRECHKLEDGDAPKIQDAMHGKEKGACWSCHRATDAKAKLKCSQCHVEE